jgi:two-component system NtrC family response regulator
MADVLIIDDDEIVCSMLSDVIEHIGHNAKHAHNLREGLRLVCAEPYDVVFLDVVLPDGNGLDALQKILETQNPPEVIIITGAGDPDGAELAMVSGAWDYLQKPLSPSKVILPIKRVLQYRDELKRAQRPPVALKRERIIGNSPRLRACLDLVAQAATTDSNVLIEGETGAGKELFAQAIHENSHRFRKPLVVVDCAVIPETLVGSTLLGHEKGAFTGADKAQDGLIKQADGGTLFLDEVGELPPSIQKAFLRVLHERSFRPLGGKGEIKSDFRLVAATNRNLRDMAREGLFREDLLYRLSTLVISLPPLRERPGDLTELVQYFANRLCQNYGIASKGFAPEVFDILGGYGWPGNLRELASVVETAVAAARYEPTIFPKHLPANLRAKVARSAIAPTPPSVHNLQEAPAPDKPFQNLKELLEGTERKYLEDLMSLAQGNIKEVCRLSGLSRTRLYERLRRFSILGGS